MLRIVAGRLRGRKLETAPGTSLRPTSERAREAIFNKLTHGLIVDGGAALDGIEVLDVFAGTGALGFEALSRGAGRVTFIDNDPSALRLIERNAEHLGVASEIRTLARDATNPGPAPAVAGLVLMDAPYRSALSVPALNALRDQGWLGNNAIVVVELGRDEELATPPGFAAIDARRYGAAQVVFLRREG